MVLTIALALLLAPFARAQTEAPLRVIYPQSESHKDERTAYPLAVLKLALEHSGRPFRLQPSDVTMQQARSILLLSEGKQLDVLWTVTDASRESKLRPIRFPIDFGLIGWRVLLIRRGEAAHFAAIDSPESLARLVAGQGHDWPDVPILRANGLQVATSPTYEGLFAMLVRGRIDYFPRAINEVADEINRHSDLPIDLERGLLLHYPSALYFFVNPQNGILAKAIESGLERSLKDGSLRKLFEDEFAWRMATFGVAKRRVLRLRNPDLPPQTPLARRELWIDPGSVR